MEKALIIALVNLLLYFRTIYFGYVSDDVERSLRKQEFKNRLHGWWLQFICMKHIHPQVAHFLTIITHTLCCISVYFGLKTFTGLDSVSFITALLFSVNPVNIQGSVWISGRNYVTATILCMLMLIFPPSVPVLYHATSYFAVNAWFFPLIFLFSKWWFMAFSIPVVWLLFKRNRKIMHVKIWDSPVKTTNTEMRSPKPMKIIPFLKTVGYYTKLCIFPWVMGIDHAFLYGFGTNKTDNEKGYNLDMSLIIGIISVLLPFIAYFYGFKWCAWGLFFFLVNIAMWGNYVTIQQQISQRYAYLANVGMMFAIASLIVNYPIIVTIFLTAYIVRLWYHMPAYQDDWWVVEETVGESRSFHYPWVVRGMKKFSMKDFLGAMFDFQQAYKCKPYDFKVLYNLASTSLALGNVPQAEQFLKLAKENMYDEMETDKETPVIKALTEELESIKNQIAKSQTSLQINLARVFAVK